MKFDFKTIQRLKEQERIRGYSEMENKKEASQSNGRKAAKHFVRKSKEKDWIAWNLLYWTNQHALSLEEEYRFHPGRKWRFDFCIPALKLAVEYNGIFSKKSRHTTVTGYSGDMKKINEAQKLGWTVLQYTPLNYRDMIRDLDEYLKKTA